MPPSEDPTGSKKDQSPQEISDQKLFEVLDAAAATTGSVMFDCRPMSLKDWEDLRATIESAPWTIACNRITGSWDEGTANVCYFQATLQDGKWICSAGHVVNYT